MKRPIVLLLPLVLSLAANGAAAPESGGPPPAARRAFELRDHLRAIELLEAHLAKNDRDVEAWKLLAAAHVARGAADESFVAAQAAVALAPDDPFAIAAIEEAKLARAGWSPEARAAAWEQVEALANAKGPDPRLTAAFLIAETIASDDPGKAKKAALLERILAEFPNPPAELDGSLLEAVVVSRDPAERVRLIEQFEKAFPDSSQRNYLREILLWVLKDDRARLVAAADRILAAEPDNRRVRAALGRWLLEGEAPDAARAERELSRALSLLSVPCEIDRPAMATNEEYRRDLHEARGRVLAQLGRARMLLGKKAAAESAFREAASILPYDVALYRFWGELARDAGRTDEAVGRFARAVQSGPSPEAEAALRALLGENFRDGVAEKLGPAPRFTDVTAEAGLDGVRVGRVAIADATGDGWPDLLLGGHTLWVNGGDGTFHRADFVPPVSGARGGIFADFDLDGDLDLYVFRTEHPMVLENTGSGRFTDRTPAAMRDEARHISEAGAAFDFDGDGLLDLYEANYETTPNPPWAVGTPDRLWRNLGAFRFEDATPRIAGISPEPMCGRGVAAADFDEDGDADLSVANYRLDPDFLLVNRGPDGLANEARGRGVEGDCDGGYFGHGIGPAWGDLNADGHLDLVVGNLAHPRYIGFSDVTRIFLNSGPPDFRFRDVFRESGVRFEETHSNASLADVDLDGDLDLFLTSIYEGRFSFLYLNDGAARFTDATWLAGVRKGNGWGSAFGDLDLDGDPDLVVASSSGVSVYRNDGPAGRFVGLVLSGRDSNGSGVGARVVLAGAAGREQVREVQAGTGTGCQDDPALRFGVGDAEGPFTLTVRWPTGVVQRIEDVAPDRLYRLAEGGNLEELPAEWGR